MYASPFHCYPPLVFFEGDRAQVESENESVLNSEIMTSPEMLPEPLSLPTCATVLSKSLISIEDNAAYFPMIDLFTRW